MNSLLQATESEEMIVPHPPEILAHMVRLHLKLNSQEIAKHMKEICVRTHVVLQLGYDLIESFHPSLWKKLTQGLC